jgi:hypothetical protein
VDTMYVPRSILTHCAKADNALQVFLNIVLDDAVEEKANGEKVRIGMVVIRGNSVVMLEALERIGAPDIRRERE